MKQGIQTFLAEAGESACYAIDIINIAEEVLGKGLSVIDCLLRGIEQGYIYYSWDNAQDDNNFWVGNPADYIGWLTNMPWTVRKELPEYIAAKNEYIVQRWERVSVGKTIGHFRRPEWDSLVSSQCVKYGKLVSLRIFKKE